MTQTTETAVDAIRAALAKHNLIHYRGEYAIYRSVVQQDATGRTFADAAGPQHETAFRVVSDIHAAAEILAQVRADSSMGGHRHCRLEYRPLVNTVRGGVCETKPGKPEDGVVLIEVGQSGQYDLR